MRIVESFSLSKAVWSVTFKTLVKYPRVLLPFLIKAVFEGLILAILFYSPRPPFLSIFGPPIKTFFSVKTTAGIISGARYLHYPDNFLILPQLFYYGQIFVMITIGVIMYGMAMGMAAQTHSADEEVKIFGNLNRSLRRYLALLGIWTITFIVSLIIIKTPSFLIMKTMQPTPFARMLLQVLSYFGVFLVVALEALFIYAYPAVIIERRGLFGAIKRSFGIIRHVFLATLVLVIAPRILEVLFMLVKQKQIGLMNVTFPEITLVILAGGIAITFITDSLVFLSTANLFMLKKETEKKVEA